MNSKMKFSVIIPNYNYGRFVGRAIESALAVAWPDLEVIVVDDGSTDNSRDVIEGFRTARNGSPAIPALRAPPGMLSSFLTPTIFCFPTSRPKLPPSGPIG
jgi:glycosyltransferase involved in cell wall biosynthesis